MIVRYRRDLPALVASRGAPMVAAEVGVAEGRYSLELLSGGLLRLYLVDRWRSVATQRGDSAEPQAWHEANLVGCLARVAPYLDRVVFLRGGSVEMAASVPDGSLGLAYIDAGHDAESVAADLRAWWPKVVPGGVLAGHDYLNPSYGVRVAADEFAAEVGLPLEVIAEDHEDDAGFWVGRP